MKFQKKSNKNENSIKSYEDFWTWFQKNEKNFYKVMKEQGNIEKDFLDKISPKLDALREGYWFLAGMYDDNTAELILTPDGIVKNVVFVEEIVKAAPEISGWKFTALKPALDIEDVSISMGDFEFNKDNLHFYSNDNAKYPDEIDITIIHDNYNDDIKDKIITGIYIFLDNYLGELQFVTTVDNLEVTGKDKASKELIPIEKLKAFLLWRQKEFVEKYEGSRYNTENDKYSILEATLKNGTHLFATVNTTLLKWDSKASHPWIGRFEIKYKGNEHGMPDKASYELMNEIEDQLKSQLKDYEGYLNIGRQTADNLREIYFACKDFRKPAKVFDKVKEEYSIHFEIDFEIYKDKYWRSFERFMV